MCYFKLHALLYDWTVLEKGSSLNWVFEKRVSSSLESSLNRALDGK